MNSYEPRAADIAIISFGVPAHARAESSHSKLLQTGADEDHAKCVKMLRTLESFSD